MGWVVLAVSAASLSLMASGLVAGPVGMATVKGLQRRSVDEMT